MLDGSWSKVVIAKPPASTGSASSTTPTSANAALAPTRTHITRHLRSGEDSQSLAIHRSRQFGSRVECVAKNPSESTNPSGDDALTRRRQYGWALPAAQTWIAQVAQAVA